jgi:hypothetical protein
VTAAIGALGMVVVGCGSSAPTALPMGIQSDASGTFTGGPDASTSGLSVAITPAAPSVCPGDCVTLAATASGGRAPYAFAWSPEAAADGGNVTVCPRQTTTYGVNATDSSGSGGELRHANLSGSANVTVTVDASCSEGGAPVDAGHAGPADTGTTDEATDGGPSCVDPGSSPWSGCVTAYDGIVGPPSAPLAFSEFCEQGTPQNTVSPSWSVCLPKALLPGQSYSVKVTYEVGAVTGPVPQSGVFASTGSCKVGPTIVPVQGWPILTPYSGGTFSQSACFKADTRYPQLVYQGLTQIFSSVSSTALSFQICSGCSGDL